MKKIEIEKSIKQMPMSEERKFVECKIDIAKCKTFGELKA